MSQLMPLPLTVSSFSKIQIGLPFWYRLTRVVCACARVSVIVDYMKEGENVQLRELWNFLQPISFVIRKG